MPLINRTMNHIGYGAITITPNLTVGLITAIFIFLSGMPARAEAITIAILGDSLVQGYGLPVDDGFVPQMRNWLVEQSLDIVLVNAGVSGDTTAGGLSRVDWTLSPDIDALVISLGGNDALRGIDPREVQANLDGILAVAAAKPVPVLLVGISAPGNFGPIYKAQFADNYTELAAKYETLLYPNFLQVLADLPDRAAVLAQHFQTDAIHPDASGVALIVQDMGPSVAALAAQVLNN